MLRNLTKSVTREAALLPLIVAVVFIGPLACRKDPRAEAEKHARLGDGYAATGRSAEAVIEYKIALAADGSVGSVHARLADTYVKTGDVAGAAREYIRAADLLPDDLPLQLKAGAVFLVGGRADDAKARAEKILERDPHNVEAQLLLANAQAGLKDLDGAVAQIEEALHIDPNRSGTYSNLGAIELNRGRRDAAEKAFKRAVEIQPNAVNPHIALANFYWVTNQRELAEAALTRALAVAPQNALANRLLANFYIATGRRERAEQPLRVVFEVTQAPAAAVALAEYYVAIGKKSSAREILQPLTKDVRTGVFAEVRLATLDHGDGRKDEAYRRLDTVLARDSGNLDALLIKSALLASDNKPDRALEAARTATDRHPDSAAAFFALGRTQIARREPDAAIAAFQEVLRLNPRATEAKIALSQLNLAQGRVDSSVGFAAEALANEPTNAGAQLLYIRGLLAQGQLDRAEADLRRLLARYPNVAAVHVQMGMLLGRRGDVPKARAAFERALQLDANSLEAFGGLVALDLSKKDFRDARARVDARIVGGPQSAPLFNIAARTYAATGDLDSAESFLRKALEVDPAYINAYGGLGQILASKGKLREALVEFEAMAAHSPKAVVALTMIGVIKQAQGDEDGARGKFERVMQIDPEAAVAANNLAWMYAEKGGNLDVALQLAQTAQKKLPDVPEVNDTLGFIYYKKNLVPLAISTLKVSAEKDPGNATYQYHLGLAYADAGDKARAKQALTRALALKADFDGSHDAKDRLSNLQ